MSDWKIIERYPASPKNSDWVIVRDEPMNPLMSGAIGFNKGIEDVTHGILQPLLESGYLGENIKQRSQNVASRRKFGYEEAKRKNPSSAKIGNFLGDVGISLPIAASTGAAGAFSKAPGYLKYLKGILGSAASGAATGGAHYIQPGESRLSNALMGGALGGGLGGIGLGISGAANATRAIKKAFPAEKIAQKILSDRAAAKSTYKNAYQDLFKEAEKKGIHNLRVPKINEKAISENTKTKEFQSLENFMKRPSLENAHKAQSDLGKTIRRLEKIHEGVGLNTTQKKALDSALEAQKKIRGTMFDRLTKSGNQDLAERYGELTIGYAKDVLPYTKSKPINTYRKGELTDKDFLSALIKNKKFKKQLGEKYPELRTRELVGETGKRLLGAGLTGSVIEAMHLMGLL